MRTREIGEIGKRVSNRITLCIYDLLFVEIYSFFKLEMQHALTVEYQAKVNSSVSVSRHSIFLVHEPGTHPHS